MAKRDPIAERNAEIVDRLRASDEFIKSGLTEKPADKPKTSSSRKPKEPAPSEPAAPATETTPA